MEPLAAADLRQVGEFRLLARLGSGGMGQVFLATSLAGRMVAVKVIRAELSRDPSFVSRFRGEVTAASRVSGLYTAPVVAAGVNGSPLWLATAFVPGPSLNEIVSERGPLPLPALWRLAAGLAEALRAIHAAGLVHRDLKPENVLLALDGPRVIDFGISRGLTDARLTGTGMVMGTPAFMSPEQVQGLAADPPADVFSLAALLAFVASGVAPFSESGSLPAAVMYRVVHAEPDLTLVPAEIRPLITACLAKDPQRRPSLVEVAAFSARATENLGLPLGAFWPPGVANVIRAQQETQAAQIQALQAGSAQPAFSWPVSSVETTRLSGNAAWSGMPAAVGIGPAPAGGVHPGAVPPAPAVPLLPASPYPPTGSGATGSVSRRRFIIGATVAGVVAGAGLGGWKLLSNSSPRASAASGGGTGRHPASAPNGQGSGTAQPSGSSGQAAPPTAPQFASLKPGQMAWRFGTDGSVDGNPTVAGGVAYAGSSDNHLYAVDVATGTMAWNCQVPDISVAPTVAAGVVCAAGPPPGISVDTYGFFAISARTGKLLWQLAIQSTLPASVQSWAVSGGNVIVATQSGALQAYDAATGAQGMTYTTAAGFSGAVAVDGSIIYALDNAGSVQAISVSTGIAQWHAQVLQDGSGGGSLVVADGTLYLGAGVGGTLFSMKADTGSVIWAHQIGDDLQSALVIAHGAVYVTTTSELQAIAAADGSKLWTGPASGVSPEGGGPAVAYGQVYICDGEKLQSLDARTGKPEWSFTPSGPTDGTPAVADGLVFFGCGDNYLYAVRA